jgi:hypothetical protein
MIYQIRYFRNDTLLRDVFWDDAKGDPMASAKGGLFIHDATQAVVYDDARNEVGTVKRYA